VNSKVKRQVLSLVLAVVVLLVSVAPALAEFDPGVGQGEFRPAYMTDKYPAGMLNAESWE
jgi:hypothetical protein